MSWYYAEKNERRGPVEDAAFRALVAAGTIQPETLVWREGLSEWQPYRTVDSAASAPGAEIASSGGPAKACSQCGRLFPADDMILLAGRAVCASCKPLVVQQLVEGTVARGPVDPEALGQRLEQSGYDLQIGSCIGRAWGVVKSRFWLCFGASLLTMLISQAAGIIPLFGPLLVFGPLTAGLYWITLLIHRGESPHIGDAFTGFNRGYGQFLGFTAVLFGVMFLCFLPAAITWIIGLGSVMAAAPRGAAPPLPASIGILVTAAALGFAGMLAMMYFWTSWIFGLLLIIDKQIDFWPAMKLSRRVVGLHWWKVFGLIFCTGLLIMGVLLAFGLVLAIAFGIFGATNPGKGIHIGLALPIGALFFFALFALMPLTYAAVSVAYEDIFGSPRPS